LATVGPGQPSDPSIASRPVWRIAAETPLSWRAWDGDYVVFDPATGQTHLLDVLAAETLKALAQAPATRDELIERLAASADLPKDGSLAELVRSLIARFDALGLIEPLAP
jgi:PqqD family protein of HPr-rel-A system